MFLLTAASQTHMMSIGLPKTAHGGLARAGPDEALFGRVVGKAEIGPVQVHAADAAGNDVAHCSSVLDLLQDEGWKHRKNLQCRAILIFFEPLQKRRVFQLIVAFGTQLLFGIVLGFFGFAIDRRIADMISTGRSTMIAPFCESLLSSNVVKKRWRMLA
jgi:hypothetical protein